MYDITLLDPQTAAKYECLTFPSYQEHLSQIGSKVIAIGASLMQQPIALALAQIESDGTAKVLSLFVKQRYRNLGIATALMTELEAQLLAKGCSKVELVYMSGKPSTPILEKILTKLNWQRSQSRMLVCKSTTAKIATAPWLQKYKLASAYTLLPWVDLVPQSKQKILQQQSQKKWYPETLNPFKHQHQLEPLNSLCLLYHQDVVGWMITHRIDPTTIRYTSLFIRQDLQKVGRAIPMLAAAIGRQVESDVVNGIWTVELDNDRMIQFVKKRLAPYLTSLTETKGREKLLSNPSPLKQPCLSN